MENQEETIFLTKSSLKNAYAVILAYNWKFMTE